jgi:hypothetical protein
MAWLTVGLAAVLTAVILFYPRGDAPVLPDPLEAVFPLPGDVVVRQTGIEIDLPVGYDVLELQVDGISIPPRELGVTPATGDWAWRPGEGSVIESWTAGDHTISVRWDRTSGGIPDPGSYVWTFRVG